MNNRNKNYTGLSAFVESCLQSGSEASIEQAKKEYRRQYKANWKKERRRQQKSIELFFNKEEWATILQSAGKHNRSYTRFVKDAALAYCQKKYLIRDNVDYRQVMALLKMIFARLKNLESAVPLSFYKVKEITSLFATVQAEVVRHMQYPNTLEETIAETLNVNPGYKKIIESVLQMHT